MVKVSNPDRVVFPEIRRTKGDVVAYYDRIAPRALPHVSGRPLSIRRYPKGLAAAGFLPEERPSSLSGIDRAPGRATDPRGVEEASEQGRQGSGRHRLSRPARRGHLAYLANQGAIELHVPTSRAADLFHPDRLVIDLDPPPGPFARVRRAAYIVRDALAEHGLASVPIATGSKGYHVVSAIWPSASTETLAVTVQKFARAPRRQARRRAHHRVPRRGAGGARLRGLAEKQPHRHRDRAVLAACTAARHGGGAPHLDGDGDDGSGRVRNRRCGSTLDRPDSLAELASARSDTERFVDAVDAAFEASGLVFETFDRFRS